MNKHGIKFAEELWRIHERYNILDNTRLGYTLFWKLLSLEDSSYDVTLKKINAELPAGLSGVRRVVRSLEKADWIYSEAHPDDSRVRALLPTDKLLDLINGYAGEVERCCKAHGIVFEQN